MSNIFKVTSVWGPGLQLLKSLLKYGNAEDTSFKKCSTKLLVAINSLVGKQAVGIGKERAAGRQAVGAG